MADSTTTSTSRNIVCPHCATTNRVSAARPAQEARCGRCKQALFSGKPLELNPSNFDQHVARNSIPIVIDLWAPWCAPCRTMAPVIERAAAALEPNVRIAKLNTEAEPELAARFGVRGIPTFVVFKSGVEVARQSGAMDYSTFVRWVSGFADNQ